MLKAADRAFVQKAAKLAGLDYDYLLGTIQRDGGIKDGRLVALRLLSFEGKSLDVSKLDALERLRLEGEATKQLTLGSLARLAELDVSDSSVAELDLSGCPQLASLDISRSSVTALPRLPAGLRVLKCADVALGSFSLESKALQQLDVSRCQLSLLDVAGLPALTSLECGFNKLAKLDLRALSQLQVLWCQENRGVVSLPAGAPLRKLSLGRNSLTELNAGEFPLLETLLVDDAGLTQLTLSNPKLGHLDCSQNLLERLEFAAAPAVRVLKATGNRFKSLDLRPLGKLRQLDLDESLEVKCSELQKHTLPGLRARFGLPKPTTVLKKMDEYQLHAFVEDYNWDDGSKRLLEVIRHAKCSLATALLTYWKSEPAELSVYATAKDAPRDEKKWVELLREIEAGVKTKQFPKSKIPFDVHDVNGVDLSDGNSALPNYMRQRA